MLGILRRLRRAWFSKGPKIVPDPSLDEIVSEIDSCIAQMMGYGRERMEDEWAQARDRKVSLEKEYEVRLRPYLAPYLNVTLTSLEVTPLEWQRYRVARNWGKGKEGM